MKPVVDESQNPDANSDHEELAQAPWRELQFFDDDNDYHYVMIDSRNTRVTREDNSQIPCKCLIHLAPLNAPDPNNRCRTCTHHTVVTSGVNSDGTVLESVTATSPVSRSDKLGQTQTLAEGANFQLTSSAVADTSAVTEISL